MLEVREARHPEDIALIRTLFLEYAVLSVSIWLFRTSKKSLPVCPERTFHRSVIC